MDDESQKDTVEVVAGIFGGELHCDILGDCNEGEINDAMESVNDNFNDFCRDELACGAGGPLSSFRSFFRGINPNKHHDIAPVSSFAPRDIIMSQPSDSSSLTQEKFTRSRSGAEHKWSEAGADDNSTLHTPW